FALATAHPSALWQLSDFEWYNRANSLSLERQCDALLEMWRGKQHGAQVLRGVRQPVIRPMCELQRGKRTLIGVLRGLWQRTRVECVTGSPCFYANHTDKHGDSLYLGAA